MDFHFHGVHFYTDSSALCTTVADFLGAGLLVDQSALIIGTPEHRAEVMARLRERGFDVESLERNGELLQIDARACLSTFMQEGAPDRTQFLATAYGSIGRLSSHQRGRPFRAYGEMVNLLWQEGAQRAAIKLEALWNELALTHEFSLLCAYTTAAIDARVGLANICSHHSHVVGQEGVRLLTTPAYTIH